LEEEFRYIVRIGGTDIDGKKKIRYGLTSIRGIGDRISGIVCRTAKVDLNKKAGHLSDEEAERLEEAVKQFHKNKIPAWMLNRQKDPSSGKNRHNITSDLMMSLREDLNRLKKIRSYRGIRHERGLPVRGQRTKSSFRHGATVGVSRKKIAQAKKESKEDK